MCEQCQQSIGSCVCPFCVECGDTYGADVGGYFPGQHSYRPPHRCRPDADGTCSDCGASAPTWRLELGPDLTGYGGSLKPTIVDCCEPCGEKRLDAALGHLPSCDGCSRHGATRTLREEDAVGNLGPEGDFCERCTTFHPEDH
jgi:hypothetical protein